MARRRFEVIGTDSQDDVHVFCTDDRERAEQKAAVLREQLQDVEIVENARWRLGFA